MQSPYGAGMSQSKIALSAKTVSMKAVSNARPIKYQKAKPAWFHGDLATMLTTPIVSVDGQVRRKIHALFAKRHGPL